MKHITIVFVPHERAKFRKVNIAVPLLWMIGVGLVFVLSSSVYLTFQFFHAKVHASSMREMQLKNEQLTKKISYYENHLADVGRRMVEIEHATQALTLMSDFENEGTDEGLGGVGGFENTPTGHVGSVISWQKRLLNSINNLADQQAKRMSLLRSLPTISPVRGIPTTGFGMRTDPFTNQKAFHPAIDISCARGEPVTAPGDGLVIEAGYDSGYGNVVIISHGTGITTLMAHLSKVNANPGQKIRRGDIIGYVGSTGRSTGPHLHYEVRVNGRPTNPTEYILDTL